jgi:DNA ligase (NAD+)
MAAIAASRQRERWRFVYGLGVPGIGPASARAVAQHFGTLGAWMEAAESDYRGGEITAEVQREALEFFADEKRRATAQALRKAIE